MACSFDQEKELALRPTAAAGGRPVEFAKCTEYYTNTGVEYLYVRNPSDRVSIQACAEKSPVMLSTSQPGTTRENLLTT